MLLNERNKEKTKAEIVAAAIRLIAGEGFETFGVNRIAAEAGINKTLIYRYFGGLEGLFQAINETGDLFPSADEILLDVDFAAGMAEALSQIFRNYIEGIARRPLSLRIMAWEIIAENDLTKILAEARERVTEELNQRLEPILLSQGVAILSIPLVTSILSAGLLHLKLRSQSATHWNGVDLNLPSSWDAFFSTAGLLTKLFMESSQAHKDK